MTESRPTRPTGGDRSTASGPVFIIGSPRSGTTAMAHALKQHPDLFVSKESYVIHQFFGNGRLRQVWDHNMQRVTPNWLRHENVPYDEFLRHLGVGVDALFASRADGRRWVDQTPLYTPMVDDLALMFPDASFLHLVRDGRAVVRSMGQFDRVFDEQQRAAMFSDEIPSWTDDVVEACDTWNEWVTRASDFADRRPDRCMQIRNEDLSADPSAGFARIQEFLALTPHPGSARAWSGKRVNSSFRHDPERPADRWDDWPMEMRRVVVEHAGSGLVRHGYATLDELDRWVSS